MKLTEISTIKALSQEYGFTVKKKYGQNFLVNESVPKRIAENAAGTNVIEIGPGIGTMTSELCGICERVVAIEIDRGLEKLLDCTVGGFGNLKIIFEDVMKVDIERLCREEFGGGLVSVCANLPYYITTPVLLHLLESGVGFSSVTVMVQKEVADRLCARAGTPEYGAITLACQRYGRVKKLFDVPKSCFYPVPGVDSTVISILPMEKENIEVKNEELLTKVIRASFSKRRKTFVNAVSAELSEYSKEQLSETLTLCGFREDIRGEKLSLGDFARIVNNM